MLKSLDLSAGGRHVETYDIPEDCVGTYYGLVLRDDPGQITTFRRISGGLKRSAGSRQQELKRGTNDDYIGRVRLRAYLIWERAGRPEGRDAEHWHQAERRWQRKMMVLACRRDVRTTKA